MQPSTLDLNLLPVLEALLREGSVARAADGLGLTPSALSHALRRLREHFGDPLFVRTTGRMLPTPKAVALAPMVQKMMEEVRAHLVAGAGFDPGRSSRVFRLSMTDMAQAYFMPRLVRRCRVLAPGCRLIVVPVPPRDVAGALERGDVDLVMGTARLTAEGLYQQQVLRQSLVCIVDREAAGFEHGMTVEAYLSAPHVGISPFGWDTDLFEWALADSGLQRHFCVVSNSYLAVPAMIEGTDLVATVPECLPALYERSHHIRTLAPPVPLPPLIFRQSWHPRFHSDPGNVWLRQLVYELFGQGEQPPPDLTPGGDDRAPDAGELKAPSS
jgi:DNA-binding transcriptional LysR family regulator